MGSSHRAYHALNIKSIDTTGRRFSGIATTPKKDRVGDIVEPMGAVFTNPLPLTLFHDSKEIAGTVFFGKPTKDGIPFTADIPVVTEEGDVKRITDKAAHFLKYGLIRFVSIGFNPIDNAIEVIKGGYRFLKWEAMELALAPIPANAEASILTVKSYDSIRHLDSPAFAVSGAQGQRIPSTSPGVSGARKDQTMNVSELLTARTAELKIKSSRFEELMTKSDLAEAEIEERDNLSPEVKALAGEIDRLEVLEQSQARISKPVTVTHTHTAPTRTSSTAAYEAPQVKDLAPGIEFARSVICKVASFTGSMKGVFRSPADLAKQYYPDDFRLQRFLKTAVEPATTTDANWLGPLSEPTTVIADFQLFAMPQTILGKFGNNGVPSLFSVPFNSRTMSETDAGTAYWVGQGKPKPLTRFGLDAAPLGFAKVAVIAVIAEESARFSNPSSEDYVRGALTRAIRRKLDTDFVDPSKIAVSNVSPAAITNSVTPLTSSGTSADAIRFDIMQLLSPFITANQDPANLVIIMPSTLALAASLLTNGLGGREFPDLSMNGGRIQGIPVITSQYAAAGSPPSNLVIALDTSRIYLADDGGVNVDVSREASLEMDDAPQQDGSTGTGASLVSLWQNNLIGLRAERFINWTKAGGVSVTYMAGVAWGTGSPV